MGILCKQSQQLFPQSLMKLRPAGRLPDLLRKQSQNENNCDPDC